MKAVGCGLEKLMTLNLKRLVSITFCVLVVAIFPGWLRLPKSHENAAAQKPLQLPGGNSLIVTYIANEGVLISAGDKQVLIDGLHREYKPAYLFPPAELLSALEQARAPYNKINVVLVSHLHLDHFHPESVGLHLKNCIDRTDGEQVFGDMVDTFKVIPIDRKESEVCLGESVLPCLNVTSS